MRDISVAVAPLHLKEIANCFAVVVPVASVPVVLKLVEKVKVKLVVPLVVTISVACWPAVQFEALMVSVCAGVSVKTVPAEKLIDTVVPGVSADVPTPPSATGTAATVVAHDPEDVVTLPVRAGWPVQGSTPVVWVARLTSVDAPSAANEAARTMTTSNDVRFCIHQYQRQISFEPVGGAVR